MRKFAKCLLMAAVLSGFNSSALAGGSDSAGLHMSARVPVVCDLHVENFFLEAASQTVVGQVKETCNSNRGFQVVASHRPLEGGETVEVTYGNERATLSTSGVSPIGFRSGVRNVSVPVAIVASGLARPISVSFSLTAV